MKRAEFDRLLSRYIAGFVAALVLSLLSYVTVVLHLLNTASAGMLAIMMLAVIQFAVQLVCFLHIKLDRRSSLRSGALIFTIMMMLVIVLGSLWIMKNLDYRMGMSGNAMNLYMEEQNKKGF